jgi:hypothetical protein
MTKIDYEFENVVSVFDGIIGGFQLSSLDREEE